MATSWKRSAAAAALLAGFLGLSTTAAAATLSCGQTITTSTTLDNDVGPCSDYGIIIGASNITFNLNGHRIFGTPQAGDGAGIYVGNRTRVTIRAGTVSDFDGGIVVEGGSDHLIQQLTVRDNVGDVSLELFTDFGDGILLLSSSHNRVMQVVAERNGPYSGITLLGNSDDNLVQANVVRNNNLPDARPGHTSPGGVNVMEDDGIRLETITSSITPDNNRVLYNTVTGNGLDGIAIFPFAKNNLLDTNTVIGNGVLGNIRPGDGIHVFGRAQRNIVRLNRVLSNARHGIMLDFFDPLSNPPGENRVERNVSKQNAKAPGSFPAFDLIDANRFCGGNVWVANSFDTKNDPGSDCIH